MPDLFSLWRKNALIRVSRLSMPVTPSSRLSHMASNKHDAADEAETTGHEWDGIKELDTPLPKWWLYVFYATIVLSVALFGLALSHLFI